MFLRTLIDDPISSRPVITAHPAFRLHPMRLPSVLAAGTIARRQALQIIIAAIAIPQTPIAARALPPECMNGMMERRQALGLDPFAPPCNDPDPWARSIPPVQPIFVAKRAVDTLLEDEEYFRNAIRLSQPTGELQLPPQINPALLERIAESSASADALREAAKCYVRAAYDANELVEFAYRGRAQRGASDAEVCELVDGALDACRRCKEALGTIVSLLPEQAVTNQGLPTRTDDLN